MTAEIRSKRLVIRQATLDDAAICADCLNDLYVSKWLGRVPYPFRLSNAEDFIRSDAAVFPKSAFIFADGRFLGGIGINDDLGFWVARAAWGNGYASEAAAAMLDHHFQTTDAVSIGSGYFEGNTRSARILEKLGFQGAGQNLFTPLSTGVAVPRFAVTLSRFHWEQRR